MQRQRGRGSRHAIWRKIAARTLDIPLQQRKHVLALARIDGLGEIDDRDGTLPIQDVVRRQIAVDAIARQKREVYLS